MTTTAGPTRVGGPWRGASRFVGSRRGAGRAGISAALRRRAFPDLGVSRSRERWTVVAAGLLGLLGSAVSLWRQPGSALDNTWAEDGRVFLQGTYTGSSVWSTLTEPYNGYLQVYSRLVALLARTLPVRDAAAVMALGGAAACGIAVATVVVASAGLVASPALRLLLGAAVAFWPLAGGEIAANSANAHWYLVLAAAVCVVWRPRTAAGGLLAGTVGLLASSTDPLTGLLLPALVVRVVALPRWRENAITVGVLAGLVVQVGALLNPTLVAATVHPGAMELFRSWVTRGPAAAYVGAGPATTAGTVPTVLTLVVLTATLAACAAGHRGLPALVLTGTGLLLFGVAVYLRWSPAMAAGAPQQIGGRYGLSPSVLTLVVLAGALDTAVTAARRRGRPLPAGAAVLAATLLLIVVAVPAAAGLRSGQDRRPSWVQQVEAARQACTGQPDRASVVILGSPTRVWSTRIPCGDLRG